MALTPQQIQLLADLDIERTETWRRAEPDDKGNVVVHDATVSVCPGDVVVVPHEVIATLLNLCGFEQIDPLAQQEPPC